MVVISCIGALRANEISVHCRAAPISDSSPRRAGTTAAHGYYAIQLFIQYLIKQPYSEINLVIEK